MFEESEILFHTTGNHLLYQETDENKNVGILKLNVCDKHIDSLVKHSIYVLFTIDISASMSLYDNNKYTKIEKVIYTLKCILREFAKENEGGLTRIFASIMAFETRLHLIFDFVEITPKNIDELLKLVHNIKTKDATNIELAMNHAKDVLEKYVDENNKVYHIFMTDGEITDGEKNADILKTLVDPRYPTCFVGFGRYHDSCLLVELSNYLRGEYRFVDKIANAGFVYGEIVYNIIHNLFDTITLDVMNGLIYDWRTNSWVNELTVTNIANNSEKIFHIMNYGNRHDIEIRVSYGEGINHTVYYYPPLIPIIFDPVSVSDIITQLHNQEEESALTTIDLRKYHYRQKTQELMFEVREFIHKDTEQRKHQNTSPNKGMTINTEQESNEEYYLPIKQKLYDLLKSIFDYIELAGPDQSLQRLGNDIYITFNTLLRDDANMWCSSRRISQGNQHTYSASYFQDIENDQESPFHEDNFEVSFRKSKIPFPVIRRQNKLRKVVHEEEEDTIRTSLRTSFEKMDTCYSVFGKDPANKLYQGDYCEEFTRSEPTKKLDVSFWNKYRILTADVCKMSDDMENIVKNLSHEN